MHDFECGQEVAQEEDEEGESQYEYLGGQMPLGGTQAGSREKCNESHRLKGHPRHPKP